MWPLGFPPPDAKRGREDVATSAEVIRPRWAAYYRPFGVFGLAIAVFVVRPDPGYVVGLLAISCGLMVLTRSNQFRFSHEGVSGAFLLDRGALRWSDIRGVNVLRVRRLPLIGSPRAVGWDIEGEHEGKQVTLRVVFELFSRNDLARMAQLLKAAGIARGATPPLEDSLADLGRFRL